LRRGITSHQFDVAVSQQSLAALARHDIALLPHAALVDRIERILKRHSSHASFAAQHKKIANPFGESGRQDPFHHGF